MQSESIVDLKEYKIIGILGSGSFGHLYLVENVSTHQKYTAKVSHKEFTNEVDQVYFSTLMNSYSKLENSAITKLQGFNIVNFFDENNFTIITDYFPKGSLNQVFATERKLFTITKRYLNLLGIALGMQYLHSKDIIHGDLNPNNIILDERNYPHITDYGLSKFSKKGLTDLDSPVYSAPEILEDKEFDNKADVYSYSMVAYKIFTGLDPFVEGPHYMQISNILKGKRPDLSLIKDKNWKNFFQKCWSKNPKERPTFDQIIQNLTDPTYYSLIKIKFPVVAHYLKNYYPQWSQTEIQKEPFEFNVFLLGNTNSGKSALLEVMKNIAANHPQPQTTQAIVNDKITVKTEFGDVNISIFDAPGSESTNRVLSKYLNVAHAAIVFTDISVHDDYKETQKWIKLVKENSNSYDANIYLTATKSDLQWANKKEDIESFASSNKMCGVFVTSWDDRDSIVSMFEKIATDLIVKYPDGNEKSFE